MFGPNDRLPDYNVDPLEDEVEQEEREPTEEEIDKIFFLKLGESNMELKLGLEVKERVTGVKGILTGRAEYLYGCVQWLVTPKAATDHPEKIESFWFDDGRLEIVGCGILPKEVRTQNPGGPARGPKRY